MSHLDCLQFNSRRSAVLARHGMVACDIPLAADVGLELLKSGGNAADAAVGVAAVIALTEPCSTGLGGDAFALFYDAASKKVKAINGSGHSPGSLSLEKVVSDGYQEQLPIHHGHCVTVPGAAAAWVDTVDKYGSGKLTMAEILAPAIKIAEEGFPVTQIVAYWWNKGSATLKDEKNKHGRDMLINGQAPKWGQLFKNQNLANTFKSIAKDGKKGFYDGRIADAIASVVRDHGGVMTTQDLNNHFSTFEDPISVEYKGVRLWEIPPSTQGIVALMALSILKNIDLTGMEHNSPAYLHTVIDAIRLGFKDALAFVADPSKADVPIQALIDDAQGAKRSQLMLPDKAIATGDLCASDLTSAGRDTTYFSVVDKDGNACSFINSNYMGFGTGIVPEGCGFTLQNRGNNFSLKPGHPNVIAPNKRPFHTIIPAMITEEKTGNLLASYGVMGGFMQPQGHVQVLLNLVHFHMDPQAALDAPRFCVGPGHEGPVGAVSMEDGIPQEVMDQLQAMGHSVEGPVTGHGRALFGRGYVISRGAWWRAKGECGVEDDVGTWWAGAEARADGHAVGY